jgi:hypothetical protein
MGPTDATHLVNFYPEIRDVSLRRGFIEHATGVGSGNVDTVAEFFDGTTRKLVAASPTNIYDATSAGAATSLAGSFTSGQWQTSMMNGVMGLVNGADAPQDFDGTTVGAMTISGVGTASDLIGIHVYKSRSYFWKGGSPSFWYSAVDALGGACTEFALGEVARRGGNLVAMTNWTVDGGSGVDDFAVFVMSSGEVLVYQGSDPGSSSDWALVGSYQIPVPLGRRAIQKVGAEIMVLTETDTVFLPSAFSQVSPPSTKLRGALELAGPTYRSNFGWDAVYYGLRNMLLLNIPVSTTTAEQYVVNMETGAPARFTGQNARAWTVYDSELYFGGTGDGIVYQADTGTNDDGSNISAAARQAWNDLGSPNNKKVESYRMVFSGTDDFSVGSEIAYDFVNATVNTATTTGGSGTPWGSPWGSPWSSASSVKGDWVLAEGYGQVLSPQVSISVEGERPSWYRTDLMVSDAPNI